MRQKNILEIVINTNNVKAEPLNSKKASSSDSLNEIHTKFFELTLRYEILLRFNVQGFSRRALR